MQAWLRAHGFYCWLKVCAIGIKIFCRTTSSAVPLRAFRVSGRVISRHEIQEGEIQGIKVLESADKIPKYDPPHQYLLSQSQMLSLPSSSCVRSRASPSDGIWMSAAVYRLD